MYAKTNHRLVPIRSVVLAVLSVAALLVVSACTVQSKKEGQNENVKVETPFGGIHVDTQADAQDVGMSVYPGAKLNPKHEGDHSSANVNISGAMFGVKVVALDYVSDASPDKVADFYKKELGKYGEVIECPHGITEKGDQLVCGNKSGNEDRLELAVGNKERRHMVSIKPTSKGSEFALVYIQIRGKEGTL